MMHDAESRWKIIYWTLLLFVGMFFPLMSLHFGITGDEILHHKHANLVLDYFNNKSKEALYQPRTLLHYYGLSFDYFSLKLINFFDVKNYYEFKNVLASLSGVLCVFYTSKIAIKLSGYLSGVLAVFLMATTPAFFGHSMNNSLDIPFAAAFAASIYYIISIHFNSQKLNAWLIIKLCVSIGFAISLRAGGLLLLFYFLLFIGLILAERKHLKLSKGLTIKQIMVLFFLVAVVSYFLGIQFWPYALQNKIKNPYLALTNLTNIGISLNQLFEGKLTYSDELPKAYLFKSMFITIPIVVFTGFSGFFALGYKQFKKSRQVWVLLLFSLFFPLIYAVVRNANIYSSWRHFLFVFPTLVVFAAIGWKLLFDAFSKNKKLLVLIPSAIFIFTSIHSISFLLRNGKYAYVYYNQFAGGISEAWKNYETDYYGTSVKESCQFLLNDNEFRKNEKEITISTSMPAIVSYYFRDCKNVKVIYTRYYDRGDKYWDYAIFHLEHIDPFQLKHKGWPPVESIYNVKVDGAVIGFVMKRKSYLDLEGTNFLKAGNYDAAINCFMNFIKSVPNSEYAFASIAECYYRSKNFEQSIKYSNEALYYHDDYPYALKTIGYSYTEKANSKEAISIFKKLTQLEPMDAENWYFYGLGNLNDKRFEEAIKAEKNCILYNPNKLDAYRILSISYQNLNDQNNANYYKEMYQSKIQ